MLRLRRSQLIRSKELLVLTVTLIIQIAMLVVIPIVVGFWLKRGLGTSWLLFMGGALAFVCAWVFTSLLQLGSASGLLIASITQMGALFLIYRFQLKTVSTEREALMVGTGQGGIELILLGILSLLALVQMLPLRNPTHADLISLAAKMKNTSEAEVQPADIDELQEAIDGFWTRPWYEPLIQLIEPLAALPITLALAVIVLAASTRNNWRLLLGAMGIHFLSRIVPAYGGYVAGPILWAGLSLLFGIVALWFLRRLWSTVMHQAAVTLQTTRKPAARVKSMD
jgi:uncharacterized membrane protein YhfC